MIMRPTVFTDQLFLVEAFKEEGILQGFPMTNEAEVVDSCNFWIDMAIKGAGISCEIDGKVAGMAVLYIPIYQKLRPAALFSIVVGKEFRRQNVGAGLIHALEDLGKNKYGLKIIHLEVYEKNEPAIKLYQKLGFRKYGIQEKFIKENGIYYGKILMEKHLV